MLRYQSAVPHAPYADVATQRAAPGWYPGIRRTAVSSSTDQDDASAGCLTGCARRTAAVRRTRATPRTTDDGRRTVGLALARRGVVRGRIVTAGRVGDGTGRRITAAAATGRGSAGAALCADDVPDRTSSHTAVARTVTFVA